MVDVSVLDGSTRARFASAWSTGYRCTATRRSTTTDHGATLMRTGHSLKHNAFSWYQYLAKMRSDLPNERGRVEWGDELTAMGWRSRPSTIQAQGQGALSQLVAIHDHHPAAWALGHDQVWDRLPRLETEHDYETDSDAVSACGAARARARADCAFEYKL